LRAEYLPDLDAVQVTWQMTEQPIDFQSFLVFRQRLEEGSAPGEAMLNEGDLRDTVLVDYGPDSLGFGEDELYRWSVISADSTRNFSDSTVIQYRIPNVHPPAAPSGLSATILDGRAVQLTWVGSPDLDVWRYKVYRAGEAAADSLVDTTFSIRTTYLDEAVVPTQTYRYRVATLDHGGNESSASDSVEILMLDADPPRSVRNVRARIDSTGTVTVSWEPVIASDLRGYVIYKASHRTAPYEEILEIGTDQATWIDDAGNSGDWYRVRSIDTSGNLSEPGTAAPVTVSPIGARR
jgi:fibronectin type 3 domain-containing protein